MGEVWKAWDAELFRWAALKFMKIPDPEELARFKREAQVAGRLSHPNIAAVYDFGESAGTPWIAMEYVPGQTLKIFPRNDRRLLVRLIRDAALAIQYANEEGIVHRDLKPENLMVVERNKPATGRFTSDEHRVYVMDFGLARPAEGAGDLSASGLVVGTPQYMAPEQARGEKADARADVWSLGATLYELLTDRKPFTGANLMEVLKCVQEAEPKAPRKIDPEIDSDLETIVLKCLEKGKSRRYDAAQELAQDLDRWLRGEAIAARAPTVAYRLRKWVSRKRALATAICISGLIGVSFGSYALISASKHAAERRELEAGAETRRISADLCRRALEDIDEAKALWRLGTSKPEQWEHLFDRANTQAREAVLRSPELPGGHFALGVIRHVEGRWQEAIDELNRTAELDPSIARVWYFLGLCHLEMYARMAVSPDLPDGRRSIGESDAVKKISSEPHKQRALVCLRQFASLRKTKGDQDHESRYAQAVFMLLDGRLSEAETACELLLADAQTDEKVWLLKALIQMNQEDFKAAIETLDKLLASVMPQYSVAYGERGKAKMLAAMNARDAKSLYLSGSFEDCSKAIELAPRTRSAAYSTRAYVGCALKQYAQAIKDADKAIEQDPGLSVHYLLRAHAKASLGDNKGGLEDFARAVQCDPGDGLAYYYRASWKLILGDTPGALTDISKAIEARPQEAIYYYLRAVAKSKSSDFEGAIEDSSEAIALDPMYALAFGLRGALRGEVGDVRRGHEDCEKAVELDGRSAWVYLCRSKFRETQGDLSGALQDCSQAIQLDPQDKRALLSRAVVSLRLGEYAGTLGDCTKALSLANPGSPELGEIYGCRASAYAHLGKREEALRDCAKAFELQPGDPQVLVYCGAAKGSVGDLEGALRDYDIAIGIMPRYYAALCERAVLRAQTKVPDLEGALADFRKAIEANPQNAKAYYTRGNMRSNLEKPDREAAIQDYTKAIEINPRHAEAYYYRGNTRTRLEKPDREAAIQDYTKAIEINPRHAEAYYYRGNTRTRLEKPDREAAIQDYTKAIEINPRFAEAYFYRANTVGWSVGWKGDLKDVLRDYRKALEVAPEDWPLRKEVENNLRTVEGKPGKFFDVTDRVVAAIKDNTLLIVASNALFGDPAFGVAKKLRVDYLDGDEALSKTVDENATLGIMAGEGKKLIIKMALYGVLP